MPSFRACILLVVLTSSSLPSSPHQTSTATPQTLQRDAQAITLVQQALAAMGGAQALSFQDSLAVGQVQVFNADGTSAFFPITKKSKGTNMVRTELQRPEGTRIRVVNAGIGAIQNADGTVRKLFSNNTIAERIEHLPALSLLSDWQSTSIEIRYVGTDAVNGRPVQVVALSFIPTSDPQWVGFYRSTTQTLFYIDQATNLVAKIQYQNFAENDSNVSEKVEVFYSDYRPSSGVLVPFTQSTYADGSLRSTLTLATVAFNTGLSDTEFAVPGGN